MKIQTCHFDVRTFAGRRPFLVFETVSIYSVARAEVSGNESRIHVQQKMGSLEIDGRLGVVKPEGPTRRGSPRSFKMLNNAQSKTIPCKRLSERKSRRVNRSMQRLLITKCTRGDTQTKECKRGHGGKKSAITE